MVTNKFSVSKTVIIKQTPSDKIRRGSGDDPLYDKSKIGSTFSGGQCLTEEEKRKYLPSIIGVSPQSQNWDSAAADYFNNISKEVDSEGLELEIGLTYDDADAFEKKDAERAKPINVAQWILYKYLLKYNDCARSFEDVIPGRHRFYIDDRTAAIEREATKAKSRTKAKKLFVNLTLDEVKMVNVLLMLGTHAPEELDENERLLELERLSELDIDKFVRICEDGDLNTKSFIHLCLNNGVLKRQPNTEIIYFEDDSANITLGLDLQEAVSYLKRSENTNTYIHIKNKLELVFRSKGKKYEFDVMTSGKKEVKLEEENKGGVVTTTEPVVATTETKKEAAFDLNGDN